MLCAGGGLCVPACACMKKHEEVEQQRERPAELRVEGGHEEGEGGHPWSSQTRCALLPQTPRSSCCSRLWPDEGG